AEEAPAADVVRAADDARVDALRLPHAHDEVADSSRDARERAVREPERLAVARVDPQRIRVADLLEPLRVARARVDQGRQAERREQHALLLREVDVAPVDLRAHVARDRVVREAPLAHRLREELELLRLGLEALALRAVVEREAGRALLLVALLAGVR